MTPSTAKNLTLMSLHLLLVFEARSQEFTSPWAISLGGNVATADDVQGLDWNISGLAFTKAGRLQMAFTATDLAVEIVADFGLLANFKGRHTLAVLKTPDYLSGVDFAKTPIAQTPEELGFHDLLSFSFSQQDWTFGYAYKVSPHFSVGVEARKYKNSFSLLGFRSVSRFFGFGLTATYLVNDRLRLGVVSRNILTTRYTDHRDRIVLQFEGEPDVRVLPLNLDQVPKVITGPEWRLDIGIAWRPLKNLLAAVDLYSDGGFGAGLEWEPLNGIYLRQGINRKSDGLFKPEKLFSLGHGLGVRYGAARFDLTFYHSQGRDIATAAIPNGQLHIRPKISGDRIWMMTVLFFVK